SILPLDLLLAASEGAGGLKNMDVVVEFLVDRRPIRKAHHDWICLLGKTDCNRQLRSMAAGLQSQIFKPITMRRAWCNGIIRLANAIAMHRAMKVHTGDAVLMRLEHRFHNLRIGNIGSALIMNH